MRAFFLAALFFSFFLSLFYKNSSKIWRLVKNKKKRQKKYLLLDARLFCLFVCLFLFFSLFFFWTFCLLFLSFLSHKRSMSVVVVTHRRHFFKNASANHHHHHRPTIHRRLENKKCTSTARRGLPRRPRRGERL